MSIIRRITNLFHRSKLDEEIEAELRTHIEMRTADNMAAGMSPQEARRDAVLRFGSRPAMKERVIAADAQMFLDSLWQDLCYGLRMLRKSPGFTAAAVLTLALGIGANTAIFSVVDAVLLRPLPYKDPARLVWPTLQFPKSDMNGSFVPHPTYFAWRDQNDVFSGVAATNLGREFTLTGVGIPEEIGGMGVSANFFSVLGVDLARGRSFTSEEDRQGGPRAAILSYGLWQSRYAGDPRILGRSIILNDKGYLIVGVFPSSFKFPTSGRQPEVFVPLAVPTGANSAIFFLGVIARLKPGVTLSQAEANLSLIDTRALPLLPKFFGRYTQEVHLNVVSLHDHLIGGVRTPLLTLMAAVAFILLIACANIANLQLSRGSVRAREFALRSALGAPRSRLARQLLTESMLLSATGGFVGLLGGFWGVVLVRSIVPSRLLNVQDVHINTIALAFTIAVSALAGAVSGFAPMLALFNHNLNDAIQRGRAQVTGSRSNAFLRNLLAIAEVAAAMVLLVAAGLLLQSFLRLTNVSSGFNSHSVLTARIPIPSDRYSTDLKQVAFSTELLDRISGLPGVRAASVSTSLPNELSSETRMGIEGRPAPALNDPTVYVPLDSVSDGYFRTLGIPILSGRGFDSRDGSNAAKVAVVNREFVVRFFQDGENPVGKRILIAVGNPDQTPVSIIGVCAAIRRVGPGGEPLPQVFQPFAQSPSTDMTILLRTVSGPDSMVSALRSQVLAIDKELPLSDVATMDDLLASETAGQRFEAAAVGLFAALAMLLAAVGIYGVISYMVSQRTQEIGIRMALGAQPNNVLEMVILDGMFMAGTGIAVGIGGSLALTGLLRSLLFRITPTDPVTFMGVAILLATVVLLACYIPARRAMRVDPMVALRYE
ncbi:MAG TPA: ABC transporter permease [Candidatus Acidoferrales bacterium]|nr:ABC transporter permease [Candidatus Acidoferrales bacterium]